MSEKERRQLVDALDGLFGAVDSLYVILADSIDRKDRRMVEAGDALAKAQDAITELLAP